MMVFVCDKCKEQSATRYLVRVVKLDPCGEEEHGSYNISFEMCGECADNARRAIAARGDVE